MSTLVLSYSPIRITRFLSCLQKANIKLASRKTTEKTIAGQIRKIRELTKGKAKKSPVDKELRELAKLISEALVHAPKAVKSEGAERVENELLRQRIVELEDSIAPPVQEKNPDPHQDRAINYMDEEEEPVDRGWSALHLQVLREKYNRLKKSGEYSDEKLAKIQEKIGQLKQKMD